MFRVSGGRYQNHVKRKYDLWRESPLTLSAVADSVFVETGLYDGRSDVSFRPASIPTDYLITADLQMVPNGDGESASFPTIPAWAVTGTGASIVSSASSPITGTRSLLVSSATVGVDITAYVDVDCHSGEKFQIEVASDLVTGDNAYISIRNIQTGKYFKSDGTWQTTEQKLVESTGATVGPSTYQGTVEAIGVSLQAVVSLRVTLVVNSTGGTAPSGKFEIEYYPAVDYAGIHGHSLTPIITPEILWSDDNSSYTSYGNLSQNRTPVAFINGTTLYHRYWRLKLGGTPVLIPSLAEFILCQLTELSKNPDFPLDDTKIRGLSRSFSLGGTPFVYPLTGREMREIRMGFTYKNESQYQQQRDLIYGFSDGGQWPLVLLPVETDTDTAVYGFIKENAVKFVREAGGTTAPVRKAEWTVTEMGFPLPE